MTQPAPLSGIRIVDLSMFMSGPLVTLIAADLGADVIKVESVQRLDGWRGAATGGGLERPWEASPAFNWINRTKRGVTLNLTDPRGAAILRQLVAISDALVENYTPRVMANFGLDYHSLREVNPGLVMLSMPGYGMTGSWRDYTAFAWSTEQMAGICQLTGYEDGPPMFTGTTGGDPLAGLMGAVALLAALNHRRRTGEGQHIDLSQLEAATSFVGDVLMDVVLNGRSPGRQGNRHPWMAPHGIYPCRNDEWIAIACRDDTDWRALAGVMGRDDLAEPGSPYAGHEGRIARPQVLDALIADWTRPQDHMALMHRLQAAGVPAGAVMNGRHLLADRHLRERGFFIPQSRPEVGLKHYPGQPFRLAGAALPKPRRAPLLGEHNREVLGGLLGIDDGGLDALERDDVIGTVPVAARQRPAER